MFHVRGANAMQQELKILNCGAFLKEKNLKNNQIPCCRDFNICINLKFDFLTFSYNYCNFTAIKRIHINLLI